MSTQRIDYVRQNIEKFAAKKSMANKVDKTPVRCNLIKQQVNDENKPINSTSKSSTAKGSTTKSSTTKSSTMKSSLIKNQVNQIKKTSPISKINLINRINRNNDILKNNNQLPNQLNDAKESIEHSLSSEKLNERRQSNEKITKLDKQIIRTNANEQTRTSVPTDKKVVLANSKQIKTSISTDKQKTQPIKLAINLNEDLSKNRVVIENHLLRLKYLNAKCETKLRKQNQQVVEIVKKIVNLIEIKRENFLHLEQKITFKETILFLIKLSEENLNFLKEFDLRKLEIYLNLVSNIINSVLSSVKVFDLKNSKNINELFEVTITKLASDLKMNNVQEFSDKLKQFNMIKREIAETINNIRNLKNDLIHEVNKRIELKNIY